MKDKEKIKKWLLKYCIDKNGTLNLSNLDFRDTEIRDIDISGWKVAGRLDQSNQDIKGILIQQRQKADILFQGNQCAKSIRQENCTADEILQARQKAFMIADYGHSVELVLKSSEEEHDYEHRAHFFYIVFKKPDIKLLCNIDDKKFYVSFKKDYNCWLWATYSEIRANYKKLKLDKANILAKDFREECLSFTDCETDKEIKLYDKIKFRAVEMLAGKICSVLNDNNITERRFYTQDQP